MKEPNIGVIHLGISGFPYGFAAMQRVLLMCKGLLGESIEVVLINRKGVHSYKKYPNFPAKGVHEGISYIYATGNPYKSKNFWVRNFQKINGFFQEIKHIHHVKKKHNAQAILLYIKGELGLIVYYWMISKVFRLKIILNYVEYRSRINDRKWAIQKWNDYLFDKFAPRVVDGLIPISEYLAKELQKTAPSTPQLKIPVICDYQLFEGESFREHQEYFLYCGSIKYREVIYFILDSFARLENINAELYFVISGNEKARKDTIKNIEEQYDTAQIRFFSNLPYNELIELYKAATALLIPLRPIEQDIARFPHKIGEYLASGNPIVTTSIGEIEYYFKDCHNAFIAPKYSTEEYAAKMEEVFRDKKKSQKIGLSGKAMGMKNFDYRIQGEKLKNFLIQIVYNKSITNEYTQT